MADGCVDQRSLPRVKEACRDFAVLEDHSLAHSLQEQEIESHLASNVHRSRLVQQDIQVARQLQEEEDLAARARARQLHGKMERSDGEVAQEMQERLVHQAWLLRQQEEKDEAIARKLQEKEVKERRKKRSTKQVVTFEEPHYEDKGGWNTQAQYGIGDVTKSIAHLDMQDQEFKDLKVARRLQEEELKASQLDKRAAQVAKDEEIARLIMEEEKKNFMKSKNWDKRRPQGDFKQSGSEGVARPRSQEEGEINRTRSQKPVRPPPPSYKYENVESTYMPLKPSYSSQPSSRPEATHKGSFHRQ
ncbi:coiled-coil domain-containing protein 50-like isoform X3 [Scleropages formosus]|uniref:Coiled-coil domain-containing protein 50-like n=1 Tax=Scleropages formosus TaxID=113540 RepID=A0A8C9V338_SCLFO|nr:coiled-coil domain-containing protein 50-like isoform X3 [Scleropages formosus]